MVQDNLITAGFIKPERWPKQRVKVEIATILTISPNEIQQIDFWVKQIWVKVGCRGKFVSYRPLPIWSESAIAAIYKCRDEATLERLSSILRYEVEKHGNSYPPETLKQWQKAWDKISANFNTEQLRRQRILKHDEQGQEWANRWKKVLVVCHNLDVLWDMKEIIDKESNKFEDLPGLTKELKHFWHQRREELSDYNSDDIPF